MVQTLSIQPYSNVGLKSFSRSYLIIQFVTPQQVVGQFMLSAPALTYRLTKTHTYTYRIFVHIHAHSYSYARAMTMKNTFHPKKSIAYLLSF